MRNANNCGMCVKVCPHEVFALIDKKVHVVGREYCMECGACKMNCPQGAISVNVGDGCGCAAGIIQGAFNGTAPTCDGPIRVNAVINKIKKKFGKQIKNDFSHKAIIIC